MNYYIHHTNGRIRVKSKAFCGHSSLSSLLRGQLHEQEGILETRHNKYAGSITIHYDPTIQNGDQLLECINKQDCLDHCVLCDYSGKPQTKNRSPINQSGNAIASRAGQIAFGMLLEKGVRYSMKSVLGV